MQNTTPLEKGSSCHAIRAYSGTLGTQYEGDTVRRDKALTGPLGFCCTLAVHTCPLKMAAACNAAMIPFTARSHGRLSLRTFNEHLLGRPQLTPHRTSATALHLRTATHHTSCIQGQLVRTCVVAAASTCAASVAEVSNTNASEVARSGASTRLLSRSSRASRSCLQAAVEISRAHEQEMDNNRRCSRAGDGRPWRVVCFNQPLTVDRQTPVARF